MEIIGQQKKKMQKHRNRKSSTESTKLQQHQNIRIKQDTQRQIGRETLASGDKPHHVNKLVYVQKCTNQRNFVQNSSKRIDKRHLRERKQEEAGMDRGNSGSLMNCVATSSVIRSLPQCWKGWAHRLGFLMSLVSQTPHSSAKVESVHHGGTFKRTRVRHSGEMTKATWAKERRECQKLESDGCSVTTNGRVWHVFVF